VAGVLIRREQPGDVDAIHTVHLGAFDTSLEADLVRALRADPGWLPELSLVAEPDDEATDQLVGHVVCTRAHLDGRPALGLGPLGVLPAHQRSGVGTALMHAVLAAADALGEPVVVLLGHSTYYPRFGFRPAARFGIEPPDPAWGDHFQARPLTTYTPGLRGAFRYAAPFTPAVDGTSPA
jgi:putative acetyltransferase